MVYMRIISTAYVEFIKDSLLLDLIQNTPDTCLSPEKNVPWILDGEFLQNPHISSLNSMRPHLTCGFCGEGAAYLKEILHEISAKFDNRCCDMVVYGV